MTRGAPLAYVVTISLHGGFVCEYSLAVIGKTILWIYPAIGKSTSQTGYAGRDYKKPLQAIAATERSNSDREASAACTATCFSPRTRLSTEERESFDGPSKQRGTSQGRETKLGFEPFERESALDKARMPAETLRSLIYP
jgi:hypothetical protein